MKRSKLAFLLGCLTLILGFAFLFIPYPTSRSIIDIYGKLGILEDTFYADISLGRLPPIIYIRKGA